MKLSFDKSARISFSIDEAYPLSFSQLSLTEDEYQKYFLFQHKYLLQKSKQDLSDFKSIVLEYNNRTQSPYVKDNEIKSLEETLKTIQRLLDQAPQTDDFAKWLIEHDDHIFGVYKSKGQSGDVVLYWAVLGLFAQRWGVDIEALTLVVLSHEYAHALSHLGVDANKTFWDTDHFHKTPSIIKESIAEYFSYQFVLENKDAKAHWIDVYNLLFDNSPQIYKEYKKWGKATPEAVRFAMLQARKEKVKDLSFDLFSKWIKETDAKLFINRPQQSSLNLPS